MNDTYMRIGSLIPEKLTYGIHGISIYAGKEMDRRALAGKTVIQAVLF